MVEKLNRRYIVDQFAQLQDITEALVALKDGINEANYIRPWQDIVELTLEHQINQLNSILKDLSETFNGVEYEPVWVSFRCLKKTPERKITPRALESEDSEA